MTSKDLKKQTLWAAHALFDRNNVTGTTGNISFRVGNNVFISKSGTSFGCLTEGDFVKVNMEGIICDGEPSKEYPLHLMMYKKNDTIRSVIHTHSFYTTLFSSLKNIKESIFDLFKYTPYLKMKTNGLIKCVSYYKPGSNELFDNCSKAISPDCNVYLLMNHGVIVSGTNAMNAFSLLEELEVSAKTLIIINNYDKNMFNVIDIGE